MFILGALAGGRQQLVPLDLPHDGQHIDGPLLRLNQGGPQVHDGLDDLVLVLDLLLLFLFFQNDPSLRFPLRVRQEGEFYSKGF